MSRTTLAKAILPPIPMEEEQNQQQTLTAVAKIWEQSKDVVANRIVVLEQAMMALQEGTLSDELRWQAEQEAHKLAGSVGMFGFTQGSRLARMLEQMLEAGAPLGQAETLCLSELVVLLRHELEQPLIVQSEYESLSGTTRPLLLQKQIISPD